MHTFVSIQIWDLKSFEFNDEQEFAFFIVLCEHVTFFRGILGQAYLLIILKSKLVLLNSGTEVFLCEHQLRAFILISFPVLRFTFPCWRLIFSYFVSGTDLNHQHPLTHEIFKIITPTTTIIESFRTIKMILRLINTSGGDCELAAWRCAFSGGTTMLGLSWI